VRSTLPAVDRTGLALTACAFVAIPLVAAACGGDGDGDAAPLPPIATTTTTTTVFTTTTFVETFYLVQPGDNLGNIAFSFGVSIEDLMAINEITDPNLVQAGQRLLIPPSTVLVTSLPPSPTVAPTNG
jgi:LysM repeat protein